MPSISPDSLDKMVHMSVPNVAHFIDLLISIPAEGHDNSFAYVMSEWTKQQGEIQGAYQIKVTTSALALLLTSRHNELSKTHVQGHLIKSSIGITTRSKAKSNPDQWVMLPLPTKVLFAASLLKNNKAIHEALMASMAKKASLICMHKSMVIYDAFFKYQTKPKLSSLGDLYHEGKEFECCDLADFDLAGACVISRKKLDLTAEELSEEKT